MAQPRLPFNSADETATQELPYPIGDHSSNEIMPLAKRLTARRMALAIFCVSC
jgi:hypothetical protein